MAEIHLIGRAASPGLAIGPVTMLTAAVARRTASDDPAQEAAALRAAIEGARAEIAEQIKTIQGEVADILEFQVAMLEDDALADAAYEVISVGITADHAWRLALDVEIAGYRAAEDEYFRARAADIVDIRDRVLAHLSGVDTVARIAGGSIVAADDITPSAFLAADWSRGGAIALAARLTFLACRDVGAGARGAHGGRARPVVVERAATGAGAGRWRRRKRDLRSRAGDASPVRAAHGGCERRAGRRRGRPALRLPIRPMAGGSRFCSTSPLLKTLQASIPRFATASVSCARNSCSRRLTACRTRTRNMRVYRRILEWAEGRPVTIRTLDAGGDKPIAGLTVDGESNPFLGLRGIRLSLARPEVFRVQLRALARAAVHGVLKVMLPMIAVPSELDRAGVMLDAEVAALRAKGIACARPPLGIMVEVPAAALCAEDFGAAFYSIGSNDLTQYTMAAARDIGAVADLNDAGNPAVLALIARTVEAARKRGVEVSLCGDAAADTRLTTALLATGLTDPLGGAVDGSAAQGRDRKGRFMTDEADEDTRAPGDSNVADYKVILRRVLDNRPSGTRLKLAAALGKNRSFVTQITNPAYLVPIPAKHVAIIFEVCHLSGAERAAFLEAYGRAHPGRLRASHREARTRTIAVTVPDLGDDKKNRALEQLVIDFAAQLARYAESVG